jgi:hypothetical protein
VIRKNLFKIVRGKNVEETLRKGSCVVFPKSFRALERIGGTLYLNQIKGN